MFSSEHDGEVLNAARAVDRLMKRANETWEDVLSPAAAYLTHHFDYRDYAAAAKPQWREPEHWAEVKACAAKPEYITDWEKSFLESIGLRLSLTEKQRAVLERIKKKIDQGECAKDAPW